MARSLLVVTLLLAACTGDPPSGDGTLATAQVVLPDTQTVAGVLQMRHDSTAFARAPQLRLAAEPTVVFSDGGDPEFDLTHVVVTLLPDGRLVALHYLGGHARMMVFERDGRPDRLLATRGQGPGELVSPMAALWVGGDTVVVLDDVTKRASRFSLAEGFLTSEPINPRVSIGCFRPVAPLGDGRWVAVGGCSTSTINSDGSLRLTTPVTAARPDHRQVDTLAMVGPWQLEEFETRYRGRRSVSPTLVRYGRRPAVTAVAGLLYTGAVERGYVIERRGADGVVDGEIVVDVPPRPVTPAMREAIIAQELEALSGPRQEGLVDAEESRRIAREGPMNDTLPAFQALVAGADGLLWVVDYVTLADSGWTATAFDRSGAIVGRLVSRVLGWPVAFTARGVLVQERDEDGVVRFALFPLVTEGE